MNTNLIIGILSPILTVILGFILNKFFRDRPKLFAYYGHISAHKLKSCNPQIDVFTHSLIVVNSGRIAAKNVRIGHHFLPEYDISPKVECSELSIANNGKEILIPTLVPSEQITISYLYFPPTTYQNINAYIKSDEGYARSVTVIPTISLKTWQKLIILSLLFLGCSLVIYWVGMFLVYFYNYIT